MLPYADRAGRCRCDWEEHRLSQRVARATLEAQALARGINGMFGRLSYVALSAAAVVAAQQPAWADTGSGNWLFGETPPPSVLQATTVPATPTPLRIAQLPNPQAPTVLAPAGAAPACTGPVDPYKNYACLDAYLGDDVLTRLYNYYRLEWGEAGPPTDPHAPASRRGDWGAAPAASPPMAF